jgi:hypothetical protein
MAPARAAPCDSSARRSRSPLPATRSMEFASLRCLDVVMFRSPRRHSYRVPTGPDHDGGNAAPLWLRCLERRSRITMRREHYWDGSCCSLGRERRRLYAGREDHRRAKSTRPAKRQPRCCAAKLFALTGNISNKRPTFRWGFIDAAHFSPAFHNAFGVSPRDFRRAAKAMADRILQHANRGWSKPQQRRRPRAGRPTKGPASGAGKLRFIPAESLLRPLGKHHWVPASQIRKGDAVFKSHGIRDRAVRRQCSLQRKLRRPTQRQR